MASAVPHPTRYTPEEYLSLERSADFKSQYVNGHIYAMAGGSPEHNAIAVNVTVALGIQLRGTPCRGLSSDMKVRANPNGLFTYPDFTIVCGELRFHDSNRDVLINPSVIVEVLSRSTEAFDRGRKFMQYQHIPEFTDYLLIAQDEPLIDHYTRQADNRWLRDSAIGLTASLVIESIGCTLALAEVYDGIEFPSATTDEDIL